MLTMKQMNMLMFFFNDKIERERFWFHQLLFNKEKLAFLVNSFYFYKIPLYYL